MADFLSTLFGGGAEKEAADKNRALYNQYGVQGAGYLDKGLTSATGAINTGYSTGQDYLTAGQGYLGAGQGYLDQAASPLSALASKYGGATSLYTDALGVNGAAGNARAQGAFTTAPGYEQGINAGIDVLNRRRAAGGMLDSGNADLDALTFGQNSQNQQYGDWLNRLGGFISPELQATSGASSFLGQKSGLTAQQAAMSGQQAGLATQQGGALAGLYSNDATNRVGLQGNVTSGNAGANTLQAQGEAAGAKNLLGAGLSVASLAMGGAGGMGGLSGLGSAFGGGAAAGSYGGGSQYGQTYNIGYGGQYMPVFGNK